MTGITRHPEHHWITASRTAVTLGLSLAVVLWPGVLRPARGGPEPPTRLVIEPELSAKLRLLAAGLHTEVVLCLHGTTRGDTARATDFSMPEPRRSSSRASASLPCPRGTIGVWHNHPLVKYAAPGSAGWSPIPLRRSSVQPLDLCTLSEQDIQTADRVGYPFAVVAVDADTWCWWTLAQVGELARRGATLGELVADQAQWRAAEGALP